MRRLPSTRVDLDDGSRLRLTPSEYHASVRNHIEYNRLQSRHRSIEERNTVDRYEFSRNTNELKPWLSNQQTNYGSSASVLLARQCRSMATPSFDLLVFGRRKLAEGNGNLKKLRVRIIQRVYNNRRLVYRNRVETNRCHLLLSSIESSHQREQSTQRLQKHRILTDLKREKSSLTRPTSSTSFDLTEPKDFYRFGVRVQSAAPHVRSTLVNDQRPRNKSILNTSRPFTAPQRTSFALPSDDVYSDLLVDDEEEEITPHLACSNEPNRVSNQRITWPVQLKVFSVQDDDERSQQYLTWRAEQRQIKTRRPSKPMADVQLEQQYQQSIRKRKEIEAFVTSDLIREHQVNDPIFAKRYRQLQLAVRTGKVPSYDPNDRNIESRMSKAQIQRTQTELLIAKQSQIGDFHQQQQKINEAYLSSRVHTFLKRLDTLKGNQSEQP